MWNNTKKVFSSTWFFPIALLVLCLLSYGVLISSLGFYWDDWPSIWSLHFFGSTSFHAGFSEDRPMLAWIYQLTTSIIGESPLKWQIFGILTRWLYVLAVWWVLRLVWPKQKLHTAAIAFLLLLYPGFRQQHISVTYGNAFVMFSLWTLSLGAMIYAVKNRRWFWPAMIISLILDAFSLFISEYFFGQELLRPLLLWLTQDDNLASTKKRLKRVFLTWAPYILIMVAFTIWRIVIHPTPRASITLFSQLLSNPGQTFFTKILTVIQDTFQTSIMTWVSMLNWRPLAELDPMIITFYLVMIIIAGIFVFLYFANLSDSDEEFPSNQPGQNKWAKQALLVGVYGVLVSGIPIWVTKLKIEQFFPFDRFTLTLMLSAVVLLVGLVGWLFKSRGQFIFIVSCLAGLAVGTHYLNAFNFKMDWESQKSFLWQLIWRIPGIEPNTILMTAGLPFTYETDNSLTAPINWIYSSSGNSGQVPYTLIDIESRLGKSLTSLDPGTRYEQQIRAAFFRGTTDQTIVLFYQPPRCLKVLEAPTDSNLPYKPENLAAALPLSNLDLILPNPTQAAHPPKSIIGDEPTHDWCYYYEKAELASQEGDWDQVVKLGIRVQQLNKKFNRDTASELVPFIQGYAHVGRWEEAVRITLRSLYASSKMQNMLCSTWYYLVESTSSSPERDAALVDIREKVGCNLP
jgi:hypothetical protein